MYYLYEFTVHEKRIQILSDTDHYLIGLIICESFINLRNKRNHRLRYHTVSLSNNLLHSKSMQEPILILSIFCKNDL